MFVIDHEVIRQNFKEFREKLPDVQPYFAVKANSHPAIVKTMFDLGASFDVASIYEFKLVHKHIEDWSDQKRQDFIWDKIIYANTIKPAKVLAKLNPYKIRGFTTVLLVESFDMALMNEFKMAEAIKTAYPEGRIAGVDQVWFADTSIQTEVQFQDFTAEVLGPQQLG